MDECYGLSIHLFPEYIFLLYMLLQAWNLWGSLEHDIFFLVIRIVDCHFLNLHDKYLHSFHQQELLLVVMCWIPLMVHSEAGNSSIILERDNEYNWYQFWVRILRGKVESNSKWIRGTCITLKENISRCIRIELLVTFLCEVAHAKLINTILPIFNPFWR